MAKELGDKVHTRVKELCAEGDALSQQSSFAEARRQYTAALRELPQPWEQWEATTWVLSAVGDTLIGEGDFDKALQAFGDAVQCPGGLGNPYIHLRLGQAQFEVGNQVRAADELARAYMGGGKEMFEELDPKYFAFLKTKLKEPQGGW